MNKKFKVGLVRVLTTEDEEVLQSHGNFSCLCIIVFAFSDKLC